MEKCSSRDDILYKQLESFVCFMCFFLSVIIIIIIFILFCSLWVCDLRIFGVFLYVLSSHIIVLVLWLCYLLYPLKKILWVCVLHMDRTALVHCPLFIFFVFFFLQYVKLQKLRTVYVTVYLGYNIRFFILFAITYSISVHCCIWLL